MNLTITISQSTISTAEFYSPRGPPPPTTQTKKNRCECCSKKLGLVNFQCKCGGVYCSEHRMSENHTCQYDYQAEYKKLLSTNLVKVVGTKVDVI